jgi:hypothetical protein
LKTADNLSGRFLIKKGEKSMGKLNGNRLFILAFIGLLVAFATQLPAMPATAAHYPLVLLIASFVLALWLLFDKQKEEQHLDSWCVIHVCVFALAVIAYIFLMSYIGYVISTLLFLFSSLLYLKIPGKKVLFIFPVVVTLLLYIFFTDVLNVYLPTGHIFS